jgi:hypothetical protein
VAVLALLVVFAAPTAVAAPGNGAGWFTSEVECDDGQLPVFTYHAGTWSSIYVEGGGHFILTYQNVEVDGEVLFDLTHPGHTNQGPIVSCWWQDDEFFPGQETIITLSGFFMP